MILFLLNSFIRHQIVSETHRYFCVASMASDNNTKGRRYEGMVLDLAELHGKRPPNFAPSIDKIDVNDVVSTDDFILGLPLEISTVQARLNDWSEYDEQEEWLAMELFADMATPKLSHLIADAFRLNPWLRTKTLYLQCYDREESGEIGFKIPLGHLANEANWKKVSSILQEHVRNGLEKPLNPGVVKLIDYVVNLFVLTLQQGIITGHLCLKTIDAIHEEQNAWKIQVLHPTAFKDAVLTSFGSTQSPVTSKWMNLVAGKNYNPRYVEGKHVDVTIHVFYIPGSGEWKTSSEYISYVTSSIESLQRVEEMRHIDTIELVNGSPGLLEELAREKTTWKKAMGPYNQFVSALTFIHYDSRQMVKREVWRIDLGKGKQPEKIVSPKRDSASVPTIFLPPDFGAVLQNNQSNWLPVLKFAGNDAIYYSLEDLKQMQPKLVNVVIHFGFVPQLRNPTSNGYTEYVGSVLEDILSAFTGSIATLAFLTGRLDGESHDAIWHSIVDYFPDMGTARVAEVSLFYCDATKHEVALLKQYSPQSALK